MIYTQFEVVSSQKIVDGKVVSEHKKIDVEIDTSLYSELRWEQNFSANAQREGLFDYITRISAAKMEKPSAAVIISELKAIYCLGDFHMNFGDFLRLFNVADVAETEKLTKQIVDIFEAVNKSAIEKN